MIEPPTSPEDLQGLTDLARRLAESRRYEEAADLCLLALRLEPGNMGVKLALAEVRKLQRQHHGGSTSPPSLRQTVKEQQRRQAIDAAHFVGLAHIYAEKGEAARAIECLEVAEAKQPASPAHHKLHGRILFRRGDYDGAAEELEQALRFNPFDREVAESLGRTEYERKRFENALKVSVHAFLLLNDGDEEGAARLRRRILTLKQILGIGKRELTRVFRECQEQLHVSFDRLEWHRERFMEEADLTGEGLVRASPPHRPAGQIALAARLRRVRLWEHLHDEQIFQLTRTAEEVFYPAGDQVFAHGSQGRDLYLIERGEITIQRATSYGTFNLGTLSPGDLFGEVNYLSRYERSGDAVATTETQLLRLDAEALDRLIEVNPELGVQLFWGFWRGLARKLRSTNEQLKSFFAPDAQPENFLRLRRRHTASGQMADRIKVESSDKIRLFREQGLSRKELMTLATFSRERHFAGGAYLFQEGEEGNEMYVILEGRAMISKYIPGAGDEALAILERGDFFGEMSLIDGAPRSADARAHGGPLTVLSLDEATVQEVLAMDSQASLEFLGLLCRLITDRLREIDEKVIGWRILSGPRNQSASA